MSFLPKPQVCVIDDEESEYIHLLDALKHQGVGWVHVAGDKVEALPPKPLEGLRLVFLDMHLGTDANKTLREITAHTANVFMNVVASTSGPLPVIIWTKHSDHIESFRQSLFEVCPSFRGKVFFVKWDKPVPASNIKAETLRDMLVTEMGNFGALNLLWGWNQLVHRAASEVINELCKLAGIQASLEQRDTEETEREKLLQSLGSVIARLMYAETGKSGSAQDAPIALHRALEPLLSDRLEHISPKPELDFARQIFEENGGQIAASSTVLSAINSMLLVGPADVSKQVFRPGTLHKVTDVAKLKKVMGIDAANLVQEVCQKSTAEDETKRMTFLRECHIVLVEVSPSCDFAQKKRPLARLVAGFLVPSSRRRELKTQKTEGYLALRIIPAPIRLGSVHESESWTLVFTSSMVLSWPEKKRASFLAPIGRLKEPLLTDLRQWLTHQGGRVGYLYLDT